MSMKVIAPMLAALALIVHLAVGDYEQADAKLQTFYAQMLSANFAAARQTIDDAIRLWPGNARYHGWRAYCMGQKLPAQCHSPLSPEDRRAVREAAGEYRQALQLNGRDAIARHNLAWLEHLVDQDAAAGNDWREAIALDSENAVYHVSYGMFLEEGGAPREAKDQYEKAIELSPAILDSPFFARYRARSPGDADALVSHCIAGMADRLRQADDAILAARLGKLYLYSGSLDRAAQLLLDAARKLPNLPLVWFNLGVVRETQGDAAQAMECYEKARVVDGSLAGPYLHMGEICVRWGQGKAAAGYLRSAAQRWERVEPITAAHNNRLYTGPLQRIDDLLPTTLVWYVTPCEASRAWGALAGLFPGNKSYASRSRTCEELPSPHIE
jgi:tetratricopeptide (TPR) repeat protein